MWKYYLIYFLLLYLLCCSCATRREIEYVDREVVKVEKEVVHDTLREEKHDSVYVSVEKRNDTVFSTKYVERTKYRDRIVEKYDTITKDSIIVQTKEEITEKRVTPKWCYVCLAVCIVFVGFYIIKILRWLKIV